VLLQHGMVLSTASSVPATAGRPCGAQHRDHVSWSCMSTCAKVRSNSAPPMRLDMKAVQRAPGRRKESARPALLSGEARGCTCWTSASVLDRRAAITPCPRLKMCPRRAARQLEHARDASLLLAQRQEEGGGSRFPCSAPAGPTRPRASSRGRASRRRRRPRRLPRAGRAARRSLRRRRSRVADPAGRAPGRRSRARCTARQISR